MITDLPLQLQGEGTITWGEMQDLFTPAQKADLVRYWYRFSRPTDDEGVPGDINDDSEFDIEAVKAFFLHRRIDPA